MTDTLPDGCKYIRNKCRYCENWLETLLGRSASDTNIDYLLIHQQVYIGWIVVELLIIYFFFVETAGKTLEELSEIFEAKNPRKASTKKVKIAMDETGHVVDVKGP